MFNFFKNKLKEAISSISKKAEEPEKLVKEDKQEEQKPQDKEETKKSIFKRIEEKVTLKKITKERFNELFYEIELALLENNVAHEVVEKIKQRLEEDLVDIPLKRNEISSIIKTSFKKTIDEILNLEKIDLETIIKKSNKKPFVILVFGYNGVGKSLTIAKLAKYLKDKKQKVIIAAADTFRAAGSSQLAEYAKKIEVPVIKGKTGSDSASIIYDAISSAKAKNYDLVLADTAGRVNTNINLLNELKKIVKVSNSDFNILVIDAVTGSDVVNQIEEFSKAVKIDSLIIAKVDTYEKGGTLLSAAFISKKPILFLGNGQNFNDLKEFDKQAIIKSMGF